jgi:hypothetical protein
MIACEKCEEATSSVLVIDVPDYPYDPFAGWFMCEECFAQDPDGWYEVLDAKQFDEAPAAKEPEPEPARATPGKRADDELVAWAYELHRGGMKLSDVAREAMKVHPYKNVQSACASLRVNFKRRGWEVRRRGQAVAS